MKLIMAKKKKKAYTKISYFARTKYDILAKVDSGRNMVHQQNIVSQHKFFPGDVWRPDAVCRMDDNGLTAYLLRGFQSGIWTPLVSLIQVGQLTLAELNAPFNTRSQR